MTIEPIVKEITQDYSTQLLIQQKLQDIYDSLDKLKLHNDLQEFLDEVNQLKLQERYIIYMPIDKLEDIENTDTDNQDEFNYENI